MKQKVLIMFANTYDMLNEAGAKMEGCTINYYFWGEHGELLESTYNVGPDGPVGGQRGKASLDKAQRLNIRAVPGVYDVDFTMTLGSDGKAVLKPVNIEFISKVSIKPLFDETPKSDNTAKASK